MSERDFCFWLQGFMEISGNIESGIKRPCDITPRNLRLFSLIPEISLLSTIVKILLPSRKQRYDKVVNDKYEGVSDDDIFVIFKLSAKYQATLYVVFAVKLIILLELIIVVPVKVTDDPT